MPEAKIIDGKAFAADLRGRVAATVAEKAIEYLEAPVLRVAGFDTPFPYALEHIYMPDVRRISAAVLGLLVIETLLAGRAPKRPKVKSNPTPETA